MNKWKGEITFNMSATIPVTAKDENDAYYKAKKKLEKELELMVRDGIEKHSVVKISHWL